VTEPITTNGAVKESKKEETHLTQTGGIKNKDRRCRYTGSAMKTSMKM
jgi:hypothetical protein